MPTTNRFAFIIPAYNHAASLLSVVKRVLEFGLPTIVVDDGSNDETPQLLDGLEGVEVICHEQNLGKGAALLSGMQAAAKVADWAISIDADGQHDPADAQTLIEAISGERRAIVIGCRKSMLGPNTPWTSRFGRGFSNFWVRASGGPKVLDSQSGFRAYPLPEVPLLRTRARRFQWEVEVLVLAAWRGLSVVEVPISVTYAPKGERISHFRPFVDFWRNASTFTWLIIKRIFLPRKLRSREHRLEEGRD